MEKNEVDQMSFESHTQDGVVLEESASELTQGGLGKGTENRFAYMWHK